MKEEDLLKRIHLLFEMELLNECAFRKKVLTLKLPNQTIIRIKANKIKDAKNQISEHTNGENN